MLASTNLTQAQKVDARPLTHQEIHDYELPEGTHASSGLLTVGVGEPVYLEAQVPSGSTVVSVAWSIEQRPLASPPSVAELEDSPLGDIPIYSPGDREVLDVAGRKLFVPDAVGKYLVQAVVQTDVEALVLQAQITGATYVGVGTMAGANPSYPQCALCHQERAVEYMGTGHASMFELAIDGLKSSHYNSNCIECHTLGGHAPEADNGNFGSVAATVGWTFPEVLEPGNWAGMDPTLQAKANIQCEHCHGAGSEHHGDLSAISVSLR
jgi:mono/diheme cytochrome c family protein